MNPGQNLLGTAPAFSTPPTARGYGRHSAKPLVRRAYPTAAMSFSTRLSTGCGKVPGAFVEKTISAGGCAYVYMNKKLFQKMIIFGSMTSCIIKKKRI